MKKLLIILVTLLSSFSIYAVNDYFAQTEKIINSVREVNSSLADLLKKEILINNLLREAESHIGKKYKWATRGPKTFDCSGFSYYVFKQFGYNISAGSRVQWGKGELIPNRQDAHKGDLIFFTSRRSGKKVGHVGIIYDIYDDDIYFIHASVSNVKISKLEGYYEKRFVGIRRIIK